MTARVLSYFRLDDQMVGINLPGGLRVNVTDPLEAPIGDAEVWVWPSARDTEPMSHQGAGRYELDVLSGRRETVDDYFFEVSSEWIVPETVVLRVPHEALTERPTINEPIDGAVHAIGQDIAVRWDEVSGADCYDVGSREHSLEDWTDHEVCITDLVATIPSETSGDSFFIRVRAAWTMGDEAYQTEPFHSRSVADAQVQVYIE